MLKGYPRLSETFIAQEILGLELMGLGQCLVSLRHPTDRARHPIHSEIAAPVAYLPEYLKDEPGRVLRAWRLARRLPGYGLARRRWLGDLERDRSANRIRRFGQAMVLAAELPSSVRHLHAHFLHTPASVARYAAIMLRLPWSVSAHAKDIWTTPDWEVREKLAEADWAVTCTRAGWERLTGLAPSAAKVGLVYHGIDLGRFPPAAVPESPAGPVRILSVGRAVEKKGYDVLIDALARLPGDLDWRFVHVGGGALAGDLKNQARRLGIDGRIAWLGAQPQPAVLEQYRHADIFVLASRIAADGDRDGLPNVLMEAQSQGLACVATRVSGLPELIEDGLTGLLVRPEDPDDLARALHRLAQDPALRRELARAGAERVRSRFSHDAGLTQIARRFGLAVAEDRVQPQCALLSTHP